MKTREQIKIYNKLYFARPKVKEWAKIRNARPERKIIRKIYKQTEAGKRANRKYRTKPEVIEKIKRRRLELRYGITFEEYTFLYQKQEGKCAICAKLIGDKCHVDHCHTTNKVRGLLCSSCNLGLGLFKDNVKILEKAKLYLEKNV